MAKRNSTFDTFSDAEIVLAVAKSTSKLEVFKQLGHRRIAGGSYTWLNKRIRDLGISTMHFRRQGARKRDVLELSPEQILVKGRLGDRRERAETLRRALIAVGVPEVCTGIGCSVGNQWNGVKLTLQVDHRDGDWLNNVRSNLRFLCPNCHSQTENWAGKGKRTSPFQAEHRNNKREAAKKSRQTIIDSSIAALHGSGIDFSRHGWVGPASEVLNIRPQHVRRWLRAYAPFFLDSCFQRKQQTV